MIKQGWRWPLTMAQSVTSRGHACLGGSWKLGKWGSKYTNHQNTPNVSLQNRGIYDKVKHGEEGWTCLKNQKWKSKKFSVDYLWRTVTLRAPFVAWQQMVMLMMILGGGSFVGELATVVRCGRRLGKPQQQLAQQLSFLIFSSRFSEKILHSLNKKMIFFNEYTVLQNNDCVLAFSFRRQL